MNITIDKPTILLMFSGGLDSLGCLYLLLTDPQYKDYEIHVHHLIFRNVENRDLAETISIKKIFQYLKEHKYREFTYSDGFFAYPAFNKQYGWDMDLYNYMAGVIAKCTPLIEKVVVGRTKTDMMYSEEVTDRADIANQIFKLLAFPHQEKVYPVVEFTKREIYNFLPPDLRVLAWSCRNPRYINGLPVECGKCKTCTTPWD